MSKDEAGLVAFASKLKNENDLVRIFERPDDFACCFSDAELAASIVYRTPTAVKRTSDGTPICTMNPGLVSVLLKELLQTRGKQVHIYQNSHKGYTLTKRATPGNLSEVEDLMVTGYDQTPVLIAIKVGGSVAERVLGVCFYDSDLRQLGMAEFPDSDLFGNLESFVIQLGVKEALVVDDASPDSKRIQQLLGRLDVLVTPRQSSQFNASDVEGDLERLTGMERLQLVQYTELSVATLSASALVRYLGLMAISSDYGTYSLRLHDLAQYMRLDSSALRALNVMPSVRDGAKSMSLFGLLNHCNTVAGSRLLSQWLKQPLTDVKAINQRFDLLEILIEDVVARESLKELFKAVPDLSKITRKFYTAKAKLEDVVKVYQVVIRLPEFIDTLKNLGSIVAEEVYVEPLTTAQHELAKLVELVETTIDLAALERNEYVVRPDFDERLKTIRDRKDELMTEITDLHIETGEHLGMDPDKKLKLENHHVYGWCFRLTRTDAGCLRSRSGYIELTTQKAGIYFVNQKLRDSNTEYSDLESQYRKTQSALVNEVVSVSSTYVALLGPLGATLSHLDVMMSFAHASSFAPLPYVRPNMQAMGTGGSTILKQARHPCMEVQDEISFIPNDVELVRQSSEFAVITGPNMGGKSTYIRQIGVICLMAQVGCFVPCSEAELSVVDCVLARVGAGDSQLKGISTFMAEMLETASILKTATADSLIIIDELGRGTSTYDGFGLAWAISQHIIDKIRCFSLFATHFHELTALADKYPQAANLHVVAESCDEQDITLLYKVAPGISDKSFGIHVAEVVKFPQKVLNMAKRKAQELEELEGDSVDQTSLKQGTSVLKDTLVTWANAAKDMQPAEAVHELRELIKRRKTDFEQPYLRKLLDVL